MNNTRDILSAENLLSMIPRILGLREHPTRITVDGDIEFALKMLLCFCFIIITKMNSKKKGKRIEIAIKVL